MHLRFKNIESNYLSPVLDHIHTLAQIGVNIFLLEGNVGAGKTFLISSYIKTLCNISATSPSFSFINEYCCGSEKIFHYDLYFRKDIDSAKNSENNLILLNSLLNEGLHFVEWGDENLAQNLENLGFKPCLIKISSSSALRRDYEFVGQCN